MKRYVKKPIPIEAIQWTGLNMEELFNFSRDITFVCPDTTNSGIADLYVRTLEGDMHANIGDYIVKGVRGEVWVVRKDIFEETYEEVVE